VPATGHELILRALIEVGYAAPGEVISAADEQTAHLIAKRMMNSMGAERLSIFEILRTATTLTSGTRDYSVGPGGTINLARPLWIDAAGCVLDSTATTPIEIEIAVLTDADWQGISQKTLSAFPLQGVFYDRRFDANNRGLLSTYPTINAANAQLVIYTPNPATGFDALPTQYVFPPGYDELFHYELAYQCFGPFGVSAEIRGEVKEKRREARDRVFKTNVRVAELQMPARVGPEIRGTSASDFNRGWR